MKKVILTKAGNENAMVTILPCKINYTGPANVNQFLPEGSSGSLYGRHVNGASLPIPEGLVGAVVEVDQGREIKELKSTAEFDKIQYWNFDQPISETDQLPQLLQYMEIMSHMHQA